MGKPTRIQWETHVWLSAIHAASTVGRSGTCVDPATESCLASDVARLNSRLVSQSLDVSQFWSEMIAQVALSKNAIPSKRVEQATCDRALVAAGISEFQLEQTSPAVARLLSQCRESFQQRFPKLVEQLELRSQPIKQAWNSYGPGLLRAIAVRIWDGEPPEDWWPSQCTGMLVQPMRGGAGGVAADRFWIEAMLTDVDGRVPEVLRVAMLSTQIAINHHIREKSGDAFSALPWTEATAVITLDAAADLGLIGPNELPIATAIDLWQIGNHSLAGVLKRWWEEYLQTKPAMPVALKALRRMIEAQQVASDQTSNLNAAMRDDVPIDLDSLDEDMRRELGLMDD